MKKVLNPYILAGLISLTPQISNSSSISNEIGLITTETSSNAQLVINQNSIEEKYKVLIEKYTTNYSIKRGDKIENIATNFNMTISEIETLRKIFEGKKDNLHYLIAGKTLKVPKSIQDFKQIQKLLDNYKKSIEIEEKNELYLSGDNNFLEKGNYRLFPENVQTIGINKMAKGFLGNMKNTFNPLHPPLVDTSWEHLVYCAGTIKGFFLFSKNEKDRTTEENIYVSKEGIDAWILPEELKKIGYKKNWDLIRFFDKDKIGEKEIIKDHIKYDNSLIELGKYLEKRGKIGSVLFIYFNLSNYKWTVKKYNDNQKEVNPEYEPHINTHQAIFLGNGIKKFEANNVGVVNNRNIIPMKEPVYIEDYIANFIQQRGGYKSALSNKTKKTIQENIQIFHNLIKISINGKEINLLKELKKPDNQRIKIQKSDIIELSGPVLLDGFHNATSNNKYISENNHTRTRFYFEFILIGTYTPSELMSLSEDTKSYNTKQETEDIINKLNIKNFYYLRAGENIELKLKEAILKFKLGKEDFLKITSEEIEINNQIEKSKHIIRRNKYNKKERQKLQKLRTELINIKLKKIEIILFSLDMTEKEIFRKEYDKQIKGLQLMGFMEHPGKLNDGTTNINAPIPYFDTKNIDKLLKKYIELKKEEDKNITNQECNNCPKKVFIEVFFFPGDNFTTISSQIENKLQEYTDQYPNFGKIKDLNSLRKNQFIDMIIDKKVNNEKTDVSKGKIPSMDSILIGIDSINNVLNSILSETYIQKLPLSDIDNTIIEEITSIPQDRNLLSHIITNENYEIGLVPKRKLLKEIGRKFGKISSFGDYQLKIYNLLNSKNALIKWPNTEHIKKAIAYTKKGKIKEIIDRRLRRYPDIIAPQLKLVNELEQEINSLNEENRIEKGKRIYKILTELFKFNDSFDLYVVGKVIQTSLTIDKLHEHSGYLNGWINTSGISLDQIHSSDNLKERYNKMLLTIHHRAEKKALIGTAENYILRILDVLGDNIKGNNYPKLKKTWKGGIKYNEKVITKHFKDYKDRLKNLKEKNEITTEVSDIIDILLKSHFSAENIYKLFKNPLIINFLKKNNSDTIFLPTLEEYKNTDFRELFFDYARTPTGRKPPGDFKNILSGITLGSLGAISGIIIWMTKFIRRRKKKKQEKK